MSAGGVSIQISLAPWASKSRSTANSCWAVVSASSGMRRTSTWAEAVRGALREVLSLLLRCAPESIALKSVPGMALRVEQPACSQSMGLSVSHEVGLSVAALRRSGAVGVDILRIVPAFDWQPVARDYLGPLALRRIASQPTPDQPLAFAREWTRMQARLKCLGLALQEWHPALAQ